MASSQLSHLQTVTFTAIFPELSRFWWKLCKLVSAYTYDDMDWLFTNLGLVIDQRRLSDDGDSLDQYSKRVDLLQLLLDAEVGSGSSRGNSASHLTMDECGEEDYNSNYELDTGFSPEITNKSSLNYLKTKLEHVFHQQQTQSIEELSTCTHEGVWSCPSNAPCEKPKTKLSMDVSTGCHWLLTSFAYQWAESYRVFTL